MIENNLLLEKKKKHEFMKLQYSQQNYKRISRKSFENKTTCSRTYYVSKCNILSNFVCTIYDLILLSSMKWKFASDLGSGMEPVCPVCPLQTVFSVIYYSCPTEKSLEDSTTEAAFYPCSSPTWNKKRGSPLKWPKYSSSPGTAYVCTPSSPGTAYSFQPRYCILLPAQTLQTSSSPGNAYSL
jgi:hypothetical protein